MAPEYVMSGHPSVKADGVLVLEKNSSFSSNQMQMLQIYLNGTSAPTEQAATCDCVQTDPKLRPDMHRVVVMLSKKPGHVDEPMRPGNPATPYRRRSRPPHGSSSIVKLPVFQILLLLNQPLRLILILHLLQHPPRQAPQTPIPMGSAR
ncbi:hypothetical protein V6N12_069872 [Hibiscus sabdariffa]|uniref:Uncharacterized protein n=1 Tax=Hibiscus sabdariffa TaxID=183260 RepID=A0ABR2FF48_9ROSI